MYWLKLEEVNSTVTDYYMHIIGSAITEIGEEVRYSYHWKDITPQKEDVVVVITAPNALRMIFRRKKYIFWAQGVWPEESYMRNQSKIRLFLCNRIEKIALQKADKLFLVSETMKMYYEKKYRLDIKEKSYIMPCSNDELHPENFIENKYDNNVFCFAGGTSVWQCFEDIIRVYSLIENKYKNTKLLLLVKEFDKAQFYLKKYKILNYEIDYVKVDQLENRLKKVKFGFVLRKQDPVNYVATPTKVLTYIANGIIPIYSACLSGVDNILKETMYKIRLDNNEDINQIDDFLNREIDRDTILYEYKNIYDAHYNKERHKKSIGVFLKENTQ